MFSKRLCPVQPPLSYTVEDVAKGKSPSVKERFATIKERLENAEHREKSDTDQK
jgi:hypothetical protein